MRNRLQTCIAFSLAVAMLAAPAAAQEKDSFFKRARQQISNALSGSKAPGYHERMNPKVLEAFKEATTETQKSTVRIYGKNGQRAMGIVVDAGGLVLTKFSDLDGELSCKLPDGASIRAELSGIDKKHDLALLRVDRTDLTPVIWAASQDTLAIGTWVVTPGNGNLPVSIGVVSTKPRRIAPERAFLGVSLEDVEDGVRITNLLEGGIAAKADVLKVNDVVVTVDGTEVKTISDMQKLIFGHRPRTSIALSILREGERIERRVVLGRRSDAKIMVQDQRMKFQQELGGKISERRDDFPLVLQHDTVLKPEQCGSPLVNLDGEVVALNIARASRISSYALPLSEIVPAIKAMKEGLGKELVAKREKLDKKTRSHTKSVAELIRKWNDAKKDHEASIKELKTVRVAVMKGDEGDDDLQAKLKAAVSRSEKLKNAAKAIEASVGEEREKLRDARAELSSVRY